MARASQSALRIAIDTGGTFTDCVWVEGGALKTLKVFSTPADPSRAIAEALRKIAGHSQAWRWSRRHLAARHDGRDQRSAAKKGRSRCADYNVGI